MRGRRVSGCRWATTRTPGRRRASCPRPAKAEIRGLYESVGFAKQLTERLSRAAARSGVRTPDRPRPAGGSGEVAEGVPEPFGPDRRRTVLVGGPGQSGVRASAPERERAGAVMPDSG